MSREELIKELILFVANAIPNDQELTPEDIYNKIQEDNDLKQAFDKIGEFIIEDRKRVVKPLVNLVWDEDKLMDTISNIDKAIDETLENAGIDADK